VPLAKWSWQSILFFASGVTFALRPEIGIAFLGISLFLNYLTPLYLRQMLHFSSPNDSIKLLRIVFVFIFLRIFVSLQSLNPWQGILESFGVLVMLLLSQFILVSKRENFSYGMIFGVFLILMVVLYPRLNSFFNKNLYWQDDPSQAIRMEIGNISRFIALRSESAWVVNNFSAQGPGHIRYQFEIRSSNSFQVNTFIIHQGLTNGRSDKLCQVDIEWQLCTLDVTLSSRGWVTVGIGGSSTWNNLKPYLEVKDAIITGDVSSNLIDAVTNPSRVRGLDFNENAFGIHIALVGIVLMSFIPMVYGFISIVPALTCIMLSGSRAALIAYIFGMIIYLIGRSRWIKLLPWIFAVTVILVVAFQVRIFSIEIQPMAVKSFRSLVTDHNSTQNRLEIWRLVTKSWLETPRTVLIGTGDLTNAMKAKFDARSSRYGLTKESLTHAHNLWLQTLGESGLLGFLVMLGLWCWVIVRAWRVRDSAALALLAAVFIMNSVDYLFFYAPVQLCFWMATVGFQVVSGLELID
jgi:O-Antigen ligase